MKTNRLYTIDLQPIGRRTEIAAHETLLDDAQRAGVEIAAVCGGAGVCGKCRVRAMSGQLSPLTPEELEAFDAYQQAEGFRLACQAHPLSDVKIDIPPESLSMPQRLQVEGQDMHVAPDPLVEAVDLALPAPTVHDLRSDTVRLSDALVEQGQPRPIYNQPVMRELGQRLRDMDWSARVALRRHTPPEGSAGANVWKEVVGVLKHGAPLVGFAVDIGTTKMAGYLVDLMTGRILGKTGMMNPQIAYGEDVVSRIAYTNEHADGRIVLQSRLMESLNAMLEDLCRQAGHSCGQVVDAVVVGNTAMHHLFAGLPVQQLGAAPYIAAVSEALDIGSAHLGLRLAPGARVYLPPNIAGYVGADHISMLLATDAWESSVPAIALDIGTNTEISLAVDGRLLSCSCASGPAFEGAHIHTGMRAAPGAIEYVKIEGEDVRVQTIGHKPAVGICGSGILDVVAELRGAGIIGPTGRFMNNNPRIKPWSGGGAFLLVPQVETGNDHDLFVTRQDINEIQLAKGAIRAGVEVLLREVGLSYHDLGAFIVAGAFGTYLDLRSAIKIGMFPPLPLELFRQVGNAAGVGACQMLISSESRRIAEHIVDRVQYIELTAHPSFTDVYVEAMVLAQR